MCEHYAPIKRAWKGIDARRNDLDADELSADPRVRL